MTSYLISLARRPDRRIAAFAEFKKAGIIPTVIGGIDGETADVPPNWPFNRGCWGCRLSHMKTLEHAIERNYERIAVYEDDVVFCDNFSEKLQKVLERLPEDWDALFIGGQHIRQPFRVSKEIAKCQYCISLHGYVVSGHYLKTLHEIWRSHWGHVDQTWANFQSQHNVYAANPWLCGCRAGLSDIDGEEHEERWFQRSI